MSYYMMYYVEVKKGSDREFLVAWKSFCAEIHKRYKTTGSTLFRTDTGIYVILSVWPSKEIWQKFWLTKEIEIESLTRLKSCMMRPSQPVPLQPVFSNWHLIEVPTPKTTADQLDISQVSVIQAENDEVYFESTVGTETALAEIVNRNTHSKKTD